MIRSRCLFRDYGEGTPHMANDLEREARAYLGAAHALGVTSGSAARILRPGKLADPGNRDSQLVADVGRRFLIPCGM